MRLRPKTRQQGASDERRDFLAKIRRMVQSSKPIGPETTLRVRVDGEELHDFLATRHKRYEKKKGGLQSGWGFGEYMEGGHMERAALIRKLNRMMLVEYDTNWIPGRELEAWILKRSERYNKVLGGLQGKPRKKALRG